eukprot:2905755-Rhodomonas_salina.2
MSIHRTWVPVILPLAVSVRLVLFNQSKVTMRSAAIVAALSNPCALSPHPICALPAAVRGGARPLAMAPPATRAAPTRGEETTRHAARAYVSLLYWLSVPRSGAGAEKGRGGCTSPYLVL